MIDVIPGPDGRPRVWLVAPPGGGAYVVALFRGKYLAHYHWGGFFEPSPGALDALEAPPQGFGAAEDAADKSYSLQRLPQEYPWGRGGDFRSPAFAADVPPRGTGGPGRPVLDLVYRAYRVHPGFPDLGGLPLPAGGPEELGREGVETLELELEDPVTGLAVFLCYSTLPSAGAILRATRFLNRGAAPVALRRAFSFSLDLPPRETPLELLATDGGWARERSLERRPLGCGRIELGSRRGVSGHASSPALILAEPGADEEGGRAWGFALLYSGDWSLGVERSDEGGYRVQGGLHPELFSWTLDPGASFATPAALLCRSDEGLGVLSARFHAAARRLMPAAWRRRERPVLLNSWEAAYFDYDESRLLEIARGAAGLGAELFVLDDGWFGKRDDDRSSLGDWEPNPAKLPGGLAGLAEKVRALGLGFGLWLEPEALSPDSGLYRAHPDWALALEDRPPAEGRNQLVLDLSRPEVAAAVESRVRAVLASCRPDYVKWDMNRPFSRAGSASGRPDGELRHRWLLALYGILGRITSDFPDVLFEGCAGGGGRADFGMLPFFPQFWASDNTDPCWRLGIQRATSLFLPPLAFGAHVSASPNHQTGRTTGLRARCLVAMGGVFGLELDPAALSAAERDEVSDSIAWYKRRKELLQLGELVRLDASAGGGDAAWAMVAPGGGRAAVFWARSVNRPNAGPVRLRLRGLDPRRDYLASSREIAAFAGRRYSGCELMERGIEFQPPALGDPIVVSFDVAPAGADAPGAPGSARAGGDARGNRR
ncbi:MAG: alpha-galactosidase [Spirochaetaceae bacterium]|nr:alpha-galactosidase [Spirochaetaceae bacterium]